MSRSAKRLAIPLAVLFCAVAGVASATNDFEGIGRTATPAELKAWDIDVRPDFAGLPPGKGSVEEGEQLWVERCSSCHGDFGDANHVFPPLIGNTTDEDIKTGRVAALTRGGVTRTTIMKMPTVSTLWDFINRAMPWDRPKSLKTNEVYAVLAYLLNLANIVPYDFELSNENMAWVQSRMPNRNAMTMDHGLWDINGKPDTHNTACMHNCDRDEEITSSLPDFAKAAHGELMKQNREYGAIRGTRTMPEEGDDAEKAKESAMPGDILSANGCTACHAVDQKLVGPGFRQVSEKYQDLPGKVDHLKSRIRNGGSGTWGNIPMPPQPQLSEEDLGTLARWIADGAKP